MQISRILYLEVVQYEHARDDDIKARCQVKRCADLRRQLCAGISASGASQQRCKTNLWSRRQQLQKYIHAENLLQPTVPKTPELPRMPNGDQDSKKHDSLSSPSGR